MEQKSRVGIGHRLLRWGLVALTMVSAGGCGPLDRSTAQPASSASAPTPKAQVPDPRNGRYAEVYRALDEQAAGLLKGDETAWMSIVDPTNKKLVARYRQLYANLRTRKVSTWRHHSVLEPKAGPNGSLIVGLYIAFCFEGLPCRPWDLSELGDAAAETWPVSYLMKKQDSGWMLLSDTTYAPAIRRNRSWVPTGPKYEPN